MLICGIKGSINKDVKSLKNIFPSDDIHLAEDINDPLLKDVDIFVQVNLIKPKFTSLNKHQGYEYILRSGKPKIVFESPVFRKTMYNYQRSVNSKHIRFGWNSYLYNEADFNNKNSPPDRWLKLHKEFNIDNKDWKTDGKYILLLCQKSGDSSLNSLYTNHNSYIDWVRYTVQEIKKYTDRPIVIRPHIVQTDTLIKRLRNFAKDTTNVSISKNFITQSNHYGGMGLQEDFKNAYCAVTYNSLSSVDAALEGIPIITLDPGAMSWPVAHHSLSQIESLDRSIDKTQWLYDTAYSQWTGTELKTGVAWEHIKPNYEKWKLLASQQ